MLVAGCAGEESLPHAERFVPDEETTLQLTPLPAKETSAAALQTLAPPSDETPAEERHVSLTPDEPYTHPVTLNPGECLHVVSYALNDGTALDLQLRTPDGAILWRDNRNTGRAALPGWCTPDAIPLVIELHAEAATPVEFAFYLEDQALARATLTQEAMRVFPGFRPLGDAHRHVLAAGQRVEFPFAVRANACYGAVASAEEGVTDLDLRLIDQRGTQLALDVATTATPFVGPWCPDRDDVLRLEFRMYDGEGAFHWQVFDIDRATGEAMYERRLNSPDGQEGWAAPDATDEPRDPARR